jgi:single-strand DNA-binding protein
MNKVILNGRITKDIEIRSIGSDKSVISNSIAVRNDFKNKDGQYDSQFFNFEVWNAQAEFLAKYAAKGTPILIEGKLKNGAYEKENGERVYTTTIAVEKVEILSFDKKENNETTEAAVIAPKEPRQVEISLSDDDLPF